MEDNDGPLTNNLPTPTWAHILHNTLVVYKTYKAYFTNFYICAEGRSRWTSGKLFLSSTGAQEFYNYLLSIEYTMFISQKI